MDARLFDPENNSRYQSVLFSSLFMVIFSHSLHLQLEVRMAELDLDQFRVDEDFDEPS